MQLFSTGLKNKNFDKTETNIKTRLETVSELAFC